MTESSNDQKKYRWNLESIYPDAASWEKDFLNLNALLSTVQVWRGRLSEGTDAFLSVLQAMEGLDRVLEKLYVYASHRADEDTRDSERQGLSSRIRSRASQLSAELAWFEPEALTLSDAQFAQMLDDKKMQDYTHRIRSLRRAKPHTLSEAEEKQLSVLSDALSGSYKIFNLLENADMQFDAATDQAGRSHPVSHATFMRLLESEDRVLRKSAFESYGKQFGQYRNTLSATLETHVKKQVAVAKVRKFSSAISASLFSDQVSERVYEQLISVAHSGLPELHRWFGMRKKILGLKEYRAYDQFVPVVPGFTREIPYEEALEWVLAGARPLGDAYLNDLKTAISNRWIDVYPRPGKRSGAYSGGCYDSHPFVLMNYNGGLNELFTLSHELGHSMHSLLARRSQSYAHSQYPILLAEVASTTNEMLLHFYWMDQAKDQNTRMSLLSHLFLQFRSTFFRQTMFAEFERLIHQLEEKGEPLTAERLSAEYRSLNAKFHGESVTLDPEVDVEWARIPHFYYNFYVYKYATSFAAAQYFARAIYSGDKTVLKNYLGFLNAGGSDDPLKLLKKAGVDLESPEILMSAISEFKTGLDQFDRGLQE
jgi:oligoendopeptidase F